MLRFGFLDEGSLNDEELDSYVEIIPSDLEQDEKNQASTTPAPPTYPKNISPSVQYGNEHQDVNSNEKRNYLKPAPVEEPATDIYDDKFLKQTFAIFYNKEAIEAATGRPIHETNQKDQDKTDTIEHKTVSPSPNEPDSKKDTKNPTFTSGHQNSFGIPIEEASKLKTTTQAAIYNTKVSPTLPSMTGKVRSTTVRSRWNATDDGEINKFCVNSYLETSNSIFYKYSRYLPFNPFVNVSWSPAL
jgi:hypothetical protein